MHFRLTVLLYGLLALAKFVMGASPIDHHATAETKQLFNTLAAYTHNPHKIMFGQHRATAEGCSGGHAPYQLGIKHNGQQSWWFTDSQRRSRSADELCDVKGVTGQYPSVVGFDLRDLYPDYLLTTGYLIKKAHQKGLIITVSWHQLNPASGTSAWVKDNNGTNIQHVVSRVLEHGNLNSIYRKRLDAAAAWFASLTDDDGKLIPVIFRPYHEMNGGWFWWGTNHATANTEADFKHLFQYTIKYLRDTKHVHNLLYSYSPNRGLSNRNDYDRFYPGNSYVDLLGLDYYYLKPFNPSTNDFVAHVRLLTEVATAHGKPAAITEVGIMNNGLDAHPNFWMDHVLQPLKGGHGTTKVAYLLPWANFCLHGYKVFSTFHGHATESSFRKFFNDSTMVFGPVVNGHSVIVG